MALTAEEIKSWYLNNYEDVIGKTIVDIHILTEEETERVFWGGGRGGFAFVMDDGTWLVPSSDEEGNGPGTAFVGPFDSEDDEDE